MKKSLLLFLAAAVFASALRAELPAGTARFSFAVLDQPAQSKHINLRENIEQLHAQPFAFAVVNGIRTTDETCSDTLYQDKAALLETAGKPLFLSLAGSDWIGCQNREGKDIRIERLLRLREILFENDTSFGKTAMPLARQSHNPQYAEYPENTCWLYGPVLFATLNLPAENNHYLNAAGRNNEFEERLIANRYWLKRLFILAGRSHLEGMVLFTDGNPFKAPPSEDTAFHDGFRETRQLLAKLAGSFAGKILLIHSDTPQTGNTIRWENNLGITAAGPAWLKITVIPGSQELFAISKTIKETALAE
ncbi:MAG: hypothetical protein NC112_08570 [Oxalobacter formigenes]|nr:hypothetical protein [Oxalobacter formigenes]